ncbi:MAG: YetF domain-containing protein [Gemmiger sp.]
MWYDLVIDGKLMEQNLKISGRERSWLDSQLSRAGIGQLSEVFYAACDKDGNFFACRGK